MPLHWVLKPAREKFNFWFPDIRNSIMGWLIAALVVIGLLLIARSTLRDAL